jgi:hypothetical protein
MFDCEAYPKRSKAAARRSASELLTNPDITAEVERIRHEAETMPGSCVLELADVHDFLYRLVKSRISELPANSDLWISIEPTEFGHRFKVPNRLDAISRWADLSSKGAKAGANDALAKLIEEIRK